jgi:hypothetical protein
LDEIEIKKVGETIMLLSIFHWLIIISIILVVINRKWAVELWKWIFRQLGSVLRFVWKVLVKFFEFLWLVIVKLAKGLFWLILRLLYWMGWMVVELFRFLFNALQALVSILKP